MTGVLPRLANALKLLLTFSALLFAFPWNLPLIFCRRRSKQANTPHAEDPLLDSGGFDDYLDSAPRFFHWSMLLACAGYLFNAIAFEVGWEREGWSEHSIAIACSLYCATAFSLFLPFFRAYQAHLRGMADSENDTDGGTRRGPWERLPQRDLEHQLGHATLEQDATGSGGRADGLKPHERYLNVLLSLLGRKITVFTPSSLPEHVLSYIAYWIISLISWGVASFGYLVANVWAPTQLSRQILQCAAPEQAGACGGTGGGTGGEGCSFGLVEGICIGTKCCITAPFVAISVSSIIGVTAGNLATAVATVGCLLIFLLRSERSIRIQAVDKNR
jgi:hypothetical protein